jgi:DNA-binding response OmpR family regulator
MPRFSAARSEIRKIVTDRFRASYANRPAISRTAHLSMRYPANKMPVVFVIARDWNLRAGVRAELRERGVEALGMDAPADAGRIISSGQLPAVVVLEAIPELAGDPRVRKLVESVPTILIASRTETIALPPVDTVLYRPVRVGEIVARVHELIARGHAA